MGLWSLWRHGSLPTRQSRPWLLLDGGGQRSYPWTEGFDLRGRCPIIFPGPGSGFQTRPRPRVLKCMCVYACPRVSGLRWGTWSRSTRGPFHLLPPVPRLLLTGGRPSPLGLSRVFSLPSSVRLLPPPPTSSPIPLISLWPPCPAHLFCHLCRTAVPCSPHSWVSLSPVP